MATLRAVSARRLHSLFQHAREPIFVLDSALRFVFANRAWEELTGRTAEVLTGLVCQPGQGRDDESALASLSFTFCPPAEALQGHATSVTSMIPHVSGERLPRRLEFSPLHDGRGRLIGHLGLVRGLESPPQSPESRSSRLHSELLEVRERLRHRFGITSLVGTGPAHQRLLDQISAAALSCCPVLIHGEPGTGKRLVARLIHARGESPQAPFVFVDVPALSPADLQRAIFLNGEKREDTIEELAPGTSIAIRDVLELPRDIQNQLVERLERPGTPFRIIGLTTTDVEQARGDDRLRDDLYFTLTTLVIRLQPLRERLDDLPLLAQAFLEQRNSRAGRRRWGFEPSAIETLRAYDWPGNLAELNRVVEAAHNRGQGDLIAPGDLPAEIRGALGSAYTPPQTAAPVTPLDLTLEMVERRLIEQALAKSRRNKSKAAELLDISRPRLYRRIKELNILDDMDASVQENPA